MTGEQFRRSLAAPSPPPGAGKVLQALWHEAKGDWQRAHEIVQSVQGEAAERVHAYLHRKEGDLGNASYWYERAGTRVPKIPLEKEWDALVRRLSR